MRNKQIPETNLIAYQGKHNIECRPSQIHNASWQKCTRKILNKSHIAEEQNSIEDPSYNHNTYIEEITSDVLVLLRKVLD